MIAGIAGVLSLAGTAVQVMGSMKQANAQKQAEKIRMNQADLEATRARREQIRRAQVARASATASAVTQGAQFSSALEGGKAQVSNESGRNMVAINQDQGIGNALYRTNKKYAQGQMMSTIGQGISSATGAFSSNSETIARLGYA